jgi:hypothetical protein
MKYQTPEKQEKQEKPELPRDVSIPMPPAEQPPTLPTVAAGAKHNGQALNNSREALARGLLQFDVLKAERDLLEKDLIEARERIHLLEIHVQEIESTRAMIESRINTCVMERDEMVGVAGELRGVIHAITAICERYDIKHPESDA